MASAKYLLLYEDKDFEHHQIYQIKPGVARVITKEEIKATQYDNPGHELYFIYELEKMIPLDSSYVFDRESKILKDRLEKLKSNFQPFTLSLIELTKLRQSTDE